MRTIQLRRWNYIWYVKCALSSFLQMINLLTNIFIFTTYNPVLEETLDVSEILHHGCYVDASHGVAAAWLIVLGHQVQTTHVILGL